MGGIKGPVPIWERDWPGRFEFELDALRRADIRFEINNGELANGRLALELSLNTSRGATKLHALYPDSFPWFRPQVFLDSLFGDLPTQHCNPIDGQLCLLGRDTRQWYEKWTLADLLDQQLEKALTGSDDEDPQGEPLEVWWNSISGSAGASFCLVDSDWQPKNVVGGYLDVRVQLAQGGKQPTLRVCVEKICSTDNAFMAGMSLNIQNLKKKIRVPWLHFDEPLIPSNDKSNPYAQIFPLLCNRPDFVQSAYHNFDRHHSGHLFALSYPMEIDYKTNGTGWLFLLSMGKKLWSKTGQVTLNVVPTLRAGRSDLMTRNPQATLLDAKRIVIAGLGAIGAPIALELAKNGCSEVRLIDHDKLEPGNSVRWVAGPPSWGGSKAKEVKAIIEEHYPLCRALACDLAIGSPSVDQLIYNEVIKGADLVIDATASSAVPHWLAAKCRTEGMPLVSVMATADVSGGTVALFVPGGACPRCLEHAQHRRIVPPFGENVVESRTIQPAGCAERTFEGTSYDLQELSLQTMRIVVSALSATDASMVATLKFEINTSGVKLPRWQLHTFEADEACGCH